MANLQMVVATVQQLLNQTAALLQHDASAVVQDETLENLERDTRIAMIHLRRWRNETAPIPVNRLPPELLRMVFSHLRRPPFFRNPRYMARYSRFASYKPLITAMLVCHKWYANASRAASLWTDIDFTHQRTFAPVLLTRSLGAPIRLYGSTNDQDNTLETIIKDNGVRIRELDLRIEGSTPSLQAILSVDMPRVRILWFSCEYENADTAPAATVLSTSPASFPSLRAILLTGVLFIPTHALPHLTHLYLDSLEQVDASNILDLLRRTPALEALHIVSSELIVPPNSTTVSSPVSLPRLENARISYSTSAVVHYLMEALDVPVLALLDLSTVYVSEGTLLSMPLLPRALAARTVRRMAFEVDSNFTSFDTELHGSGVSLEVSLHRRNLPDAEWARYALTTFPTMLPLSGVEEFHIQARRWDAPRDVLSRLAAYMPEVLTLLVRHDPRDDRDDDDEDRDGHMELARAVARILMSDNPVLFPELAYLEVIVSSIRTTFCRTLARALKHRHQSGRRVRKFRIRIGDEHLFQWKLKRRDSGRRKPDYWKTGIFNHVDVCEISDGFIDDCGGDEQREGWGKWKDCVQRAPHEYWQE